MMKGKDTGPFYEKLPKIKILLLFHISKIYTLSTVFTINNVFGSHIKVVLISIDEIERNSTYRELFLRTIFKILLQSEA